MSKSGHLRKLPSESSHQSLTGGKSLALIKLEKRAATVLKPENRQLKGVEGGKKCKCCNLWKRGEKVSGSGKRAKSLKCTSWVVLINWIFLKDDIICAACD